MRFILFLILVSISFNSYSSSFDCISQFPDLKVPVTHINGVPVEGTQSEFTRNLVDAGYIDLWSVTEKDDVMVGPFFDEVARVRTLLNNSGHVHSALALINVSDEKHLIKTMRKICNGFSHSSRYFPYIGCTLMPEDIKIDADTDLEKYSGRFIQLLSVEDELQLEKDIRNSLNKHMSSLYTEDTETMDTLVSNILVFIKKSFIVNRAVTFIAARDKKDASLSIAIVYTNGLNESDENNF